MTAARLLSCPLCGSPGVSATEREELGRRRVRVRARCGQCGTWRVLVVKRRAARAIERRLRRDRRRIQRSLRHAERLGQEQAQEETASPRAR